MKPIRTLLSLALTLLLLVSCMPAAAEDAGYTLGRRIPDFTVTTWDGQTISLYGLLEEKDMVLINVWATWCGPCRNEFPYMQQAYEQYADDVAIIALSCEPTDTDAVLADFVRSMGLTFYVAQDTVGMAQKLYAEAIPTTIVVDRYGVICFRTAGSLTGAAQFTNLFDVFVGEDYPSSTLLTALPTGKPTVAPAAEADLAAALGTSAAMNPTGRFTWPMAPDTVDGRSVLASTNARQDGATASVDVPVTARAGDAIAVTFRTSVEQIFDLFSISVNGNVVKSFSGEHGWMTWAIPVTADGEYTLTLSYTKDGTSYGGLDTVWVDSVEVLTGDAAAAALQANPVYPTAEETVLTVATQTAREIVFGDEFGILAANFGDAAYYITNADAVQIDAVISPDIDPEAAFFYNAGTSAITPLSAAATESGFSLQTTVDSTQTTGYTYSIVVLYERAVGGGLHPIILFRDESHVNTFVSANRLGTWKYAPADHSLSQPGGSVTGDVTYVIRYVDQDGQPVPGVMVQVCDEETCRVLTTDETGTAAFTAPAYAWEIHALRFPEGYEGDTDTVTPAPVQGGEMTFTVTRQ